jgi:Phage capsid protein
MSQFVPASFQVKYDNNVKLMLQQHKPKLIGCYDRQDDTGTEKVKVQDLIGNTAAQENSERHGDTKYNNTPHDGIWIPKPNELYFADLVDNADKLATMIDLQGAYTKTGAGTVARAQDQRLLEGFYGNVISGKDGTTITPFPLGNIIPVTAGGAAGAQHMNTEKLRQAGMMLTQNYADADDDSEERYMILTAVQNNDLLTEVPATSNEFKAAYGGEFSNGKILRMLGWTFIHLELANPLLGTVAGLSVDGNGYRRTPFWTKSGLRANFWQELRTMVDRLPQKLGSIQVFAGTTVAATRTEAGKSGQILNSEV